MPNLIVFEVVPECRDSINRQIADAEYEIVAEATRLSEAGPVLQGLVDQRFSGDVILLGGDLAYEAPPHELRVVLPLESREIVVESDSGRGGEARAVRETVRRCKIDAAVIGISRYPMSRIRVEVDYDLTRAGLFEGRLLAAIEAVNRFRQ